MFQNIVQSTQLLYAQNDASKIISWLHDMFIAKYDAFISYTREHMQNSYAHSNPSKNQQLNNKHLTFVEEKLKQTVCLIDFALDFIPIINLTKHQESFSSNDSDIVSLFGHIVSRLQSLRIGETLLQTIKFSIKLANRLGITRLQSAPKAMFKVYLENSTISMENFSNNNDIEISDSEIEILEENFQLTILLLEFDSSDFSDKIAEMHVCYAHECVQSNVKFSVL